MAFLVHGSSTGEATKSMTRFMVMTQDERWAAKYNEVKAFIEREHRNPSRHRIEEHAMLNWLKASRKKMNAVGLKEERLANSRRKQRLKSSMDISRELSQVGGIMTSLPKRCCVK